MKKLALISVGFIVSFLISSKVFSQNPREDNKFGVNATILGPTLFISASLDYFITPSICSEVGGGAIGYYGGFRYHFGGSSSKNWTPYLGGYFAYTVVPGFLKDDIKAKALYIPIGLHYLSENGFTFSIEGSGFISGQFKNELTPWGGIKLGKHF